MARVLTFALIAFFFLTLLPAAEAAKAVRTIASPTDSSGNLCAIVDVLRTVWGPDFESNYKKYMLGSSPLVVLISRDEMKRIASANRDRKLMDGETTHGFTVGEWPNARSFVVYDDQAPFLVAKTIFHELGHQDFRPDGLSPSAEEAYVRKIVETAFFE